MGTRCYLGAVRGEYCGCDHGGASVSGGPGIGQLTGDAHWLSGRPPVPMGMRKDEEGRVRGTTGLTDAQARVGTYGHTSCLPPPLHLSP